MAESTPLQRLAQTGLFLPFIAVTWLCGGLITNVLQLLNFMLVFPFSRRLYTIINGYLVWWWWLTIIWAFDWWAEWDVRFFCPNGDFDVKRQENTIVLGNHYGDVDWMIGWLLAERHGTLGHAKSYMKSFTKYLPILGWSWYFADYVFLDRSWNKDESTLRKTFASLNKYPAETPFWIGLFAEGTRQTPEKLAQSQQYCRENGKPVLKNVLWPRTRGFASTIEGLKGKVDAVYCFNMCCPDKERMPSFLGLLCAKPAVIQVSMRRYPVSDLPKTEEGLKEFCCRVHIEKDQLMEECFTKGRYPGVERTFPRHLAPRLSIWFWTILVQGGLAYLVLTLKSAWVVRSIVAVYVIFSLLVFVMINYAEAKTKKSSSKKSD